MRRPLKFLEALPLSIFLLFLRFFDTAIAQSWKAAFIGGSLAAVITILYGFHEKMIFNRVLLGINLYLISGGIAVITHQWWLNTLYHDLQASGILVWVFFVGLVSLGLSPRGFIGVDDPDRKKVKQLSLYLLLVSAVALLISFGFRGNRVLSEVIPFVILFIAGSRLRSGLTVK